MITRKKLKFSSLVAFFTLLSVQITSHSYEFPVFKERRSGVSVALVAEESGRFKSLQTLTTLGQECIDGAGVAVKKEYNIAVMPKYSFGSDIVLVFHDVDRFGNKVVSKVITCHFDQTLNRILSIEK
ncbi:MAG: hypothetical protein B7Y59_10000 [Burkholderiales bacterium 35-55-47]|jgi:hypothetical protein|uniref:hypothetical protein n=1 Tax=Limnohabitans sp. TaxID=1907725 RepID=UPI000BCDE795|nr:hypothetical protein [Limnohabitans sp.]OYY17962.1 MAG: hypothetical protein B7Y59_10000 [Burkholderiales bacterium 35-55-47]OYZ73499.1 MAG: hypothetical protein B7Y06_05545 [Burkholderiales bacterium 24-55-52]OZB00645.1 MAG: hypothetical protein B7X62_05560 [Burkholderiales bacterium 39-55-53]HQR85610.1 hypothetical protein [Limnohabitans sp.]HQS26472.1 hypothetical protein [Limnohabitans sp.]